MVGKLRVFPDPVVGIQDHLGFLVDDMFEKLQVFHHIFRPFCTHYRIYYKTRSMLSK